MIDISKEQPVILADFARTIDCHYVTILGWSKVGRLAADRKTNVKLETIKLPRGRCTSKAAYLRFVDLLNGVNGSAAVEPVPMPSPKPKSRKMSKARRRKAGAK